MKRTEPVLVGDILRQFFERPFVARKLAEGRLPELWQEVVGSHIASLTHTFELKQGILYVGISSSVARQEIFFRRDELMTLLNQRSGHRIVNAIIVK
jgi:predicted nucleic acid-binding Zn ribbon protein